MATCQTCRYWHGNEFAFNALCRRYPPKLFRYTLHDQQYFEQMQPSTDGLDYCGEHAPRDAAPVAQTRETCSTCPNQPSCLANEHCAANGVRI